MFPNFYDCDLLTRYRFYFYIFEYVVPSDGAHGSFENGSWNGVIGMLVRNVNEFN